MLGNEGDAVWASGQAYEPYVGRWSREVASVFLSWLAVPPGRRWLDVGCGTGALTDAILTVAQPLEITAVDPSAAFVEFAQHRITDTRVTFRVGDAQALPVEPASCDAVVSGLVLNFVPDPRKALSEMRRAAAPNGRVGLYVWDYAGEMQMIRYFWDAAVSLHPAALEFDEGRHFPVCRPEALEALFRAAGFGDVNVRPIDVPTVFADFDDFWSPFLGGQGPAPAYAMSLPEDERMALREELQRSLPIGTDGSIHLIARAWAARARR
jgi:SAM-dependent methyltransferase